MILPVGEELEGQLIISDCCQECMSSICILVCIELLKIWYLFVIQTLYKLIEHHCYKNNLLSFPHIFLTGKGVWWGPAERRCLIIKTNPYHITQIMIHKQNFQGFEHLHLRGLRKQFLDQPSLLDQVVMLLWHALLSFWHSGEFISLPSCCVLFLHFWTIFICRVVICYWPHLGTRLPRCPTVQ